MEPKKGEIICDACGHSMYDESLGFNYDHLTINLSGGTKFHSEQIRVEKMFGKKYFSVCNCCMIKSYGVKPINNAQ